MLVLIAALLSCTTDTPIDDSGTDSGTETGADGGSTFPPPLFEPAYFTVYGTFGVDSEAGTLQTFVVDGATVQPWVALRFLNEDLSAECWVVFTPMVAAEVPLELWSWQDATTDEWMEHTAFSMPADSLVQADDGCADWDVGTYGTAEDYAWPYAWGVGVGNIRQDVREEAASPKGDPWLAERLDADELLGASWSSEIFGAEPRWASHTALGSWAEGGTLTLDAEGRPTDLMTGQEVLDAGHPIPSGVYVLQPLRVWPTDGWFPGE